MRAVIQRVATASVTVNAVVVASILEGLLVLVGIEDADTNEDIQWLSSKIVGLRIFDDADGIPNLSLKDIGGNLLLVSQFTLHAAVQKGNRPSYSKASKASVALPIYEALIKTFETALNHPIQTGVFGAAMTVSLENNGPLTIMLDTKHKALF